MTIIWEGFSISSWERSEQTTRYEERRGGLFMGGMTNLGGSRRMGGGMSDMGGGGW